MQEVSRVHSTSAIAEGRNEPNPTLNPYYIVGFVDSEGCFCVSVSKHKTLKRRIEVRPEFEIELRADDLPILERIQKVFGCGKIYHLDYQRYGWLPHVKYKVSSVKDLQEKIIPFFQRYPLQTKKAKTFLIFSKVVNLVAQKKHLQYGGFEQILKLRQQMRQLNQKVRNR